MTEEGRTTANPTVIFSAPKVVELVDRAVPEPAAGELLVATRRTLISTGTELTILLGQFPEGSSWAALAQYPFTAGYSNVGDVVAVGEGVSRDWVGRRVASMGGHARFVAIEAGSAYCAPSESSLLDALTLTSLGQIVMNGVRRADIRWGDAVVVYGLGLLGQLAVRFARLCGAYPVIGVDVSSRRVGMLPDGPAVFGIDPAEKRVDAEVARLTLGRMADVIVEATGNPDLIPDEFAAFKPSQGRFLVLSSPRGEGTMFNFHDLSNAPSHTIIGAHLTSHPPFESPRDPWTLARNAELFHALLLDGQIDVAPLITDRLPYRDAPHAYEMLTKDRSGSMAVILDWADDRVAGG